MSSTIGVELKGGMYTFMSLKLHTSDMKIIDEKLADKVQQAPGFFKDTPVVLDLTVLEEQDLEIDTIALLDCIRRHHLVPIVVSIGNKSSRLVQSIAIPLIESGARRNDSAKDGSRQGSESSTTKLVDSSTLTLPDVDLSVSREVEYVVKAPLLIDKPVRSGQQVYARDTDLIVMGQVGPGAEIIADNNIHIYGPLRGRALCGVSGNVSARIFCQSLEAELVSVAGNYRMLETIPEELRGKPAQIWLDKDRLTIEPL
ncbi:septum site-determining protein MinC [Granulosicoccus antarcticus]|uniref:Probable septum site-determining protein MinC n=1 Tax=Granulosicoccus antarcticus IMCC3135 TaxID=1192854 RepID=A0A2Z2NZS5_9GAMM|nr:septum site-determining protein MinC [Granulosicoccus antarcticus]ASJ75945.1 Septum site-determining protein MinC [Granulosicoccus antarcticus IMCC3135]